MAKFDLKNIDLSRLREFKFDARTFRERRDIIIIAILIIVSVLLFLFPVRFLKAQINLKSAQIEATKKLISEKQTQYDTLIQLQQEYPSAKDDIGKINQAIPTGSQIPELLVTVNDLANVSGMVLMSFSASEEEAGAGAVVAAPADEGITAPPATPTAAARPAGGLKKLKLTLALTGNYKTIKAALDNFEKNLRLIAITSISFPGVTIERGEKEPLINLSLQADTYYK